MAITLRRRHEHKTPPDSMTLVEHLTELRRRVLVCAVAFIVAATVAFLVYNHILSFLQHPYSQVNGKHCNLYATSPLAGLSFRVHIAPYRPLPPPPPPP